MIIFVKHNAMGFTLLELLLVLVLSAALAAEGLGMFQLQSRNFKVEKTALQLQQWLQAGLAFYNDCQQWPSDSAHDKNIISAMTGQSRFTKEECPALANQFRVYMPPGSEINGPWHYLDETEQSVRNHYAFKPFNTDKNVRVFSVLTTIGRNSSALFNSANMIAGRLPNGGVDSQQDFLTVHAEVNTQSQSASSAHGFIIDMQNIESMTDSRIAGEKQYHDCPAGTVYQVGKAFSALKSYEFGIIPAGVHKSDIHIDNLSNNIIKPRVYMEGDCAGGSGCTDSNGRDNEVFLISACLPCGKPGQPVCLLENNADKVLSSWRY